MKYNEISQNTYYKYGELQILIIILLYKARCSYSCTHSCEHG